MPALSVAAAPTPWHRPLRDALVAGSLSQAQHYEARSYRSWIDADGRSNARIVFDDEGKAWWQSVLDSALRPRRGGPRFVSEDEAAAAQSLADDPRTNEQLSYDLMIDLLRAGALAEAKDVFGARQPGVRLVTMMDAAAPRDAFGRLLATVQTEDGCVSLPGSVLERSLCETGAIEVILDAYGNPFDLGRTQRLFNANQRLLLAVRDGGCLWPGCDRPPSYCEAHHIDQWDRDQGKTDIDRGVLLCRHHHMLLHHAGWRITRDGKGAFFLWAPPGSGTEPVALQSKSPLRWAFDPPPDRHWRTAA